jgi:hypothetical protein
MSTNRRHREALSIFEEAGIELQNSKPDGGPRRWFTAGLPTMKGINELEMVAAYLDQSLQRTASRLAAAQFAKAQETLRIRSAEDLGVSE